MEFEMTRELELNDSELELVLGGRAASGGGGSSWGSAYGNSGAYGYLPSTASGAYTNTFSANASGAGLGIGLTGTNSAGFGASQAYYGGAYSGAGASGGSTGYYY